MSSGAVFGALARGFFGFLQPVRIAVQGDDFATVDEAGIHRVYAGIALPNPPSVRLHEYFGFRHVGTFSEVGNKFGRYWDVAWFERRRPDGRPETGSC